MMKRRRSQTMTTPTTKRQKTNARVSFAGEPSVVPIDAIKSSIMTEAEKRTSWYRPYELDAIKGEAWSLCQNAIQTALGGNISLAAALPYLPSIDYTPAGREEFRGLERYLNFERQKRKITVKKAVLKLQQLLRENQPIVSAIGPYETVSASLLADKTSDYTAWARTVALKIGFQDRSEAYRSTSNAELNFLRGNVDGSFVSITRSLVA